MDEKMIIGEILKENGRRNRKFAAGVDAGGCLADSPGAVSFTQPALPPKREGVGSVGGGVR